ncbi:alpha-amylase family glycosyl hydrolase [Novosphingobium sp. PASSN1]|uniref:alpha-amylase family glycosyl hydrolase n=1 Tax=Novosphingobium sp. PASSN1 TaxID=2015561 RepID=UPI000BDA2DD0|nr:alpha-amylase family glycosyl hydrolase [Novosphingobium sp. PASSN1]OYU37004.1 MAG: alpha-amylase [Novosphingobium sp. PASSN1]
MIRHLALAALLAFPGHVQAAQPLPITDGVSAVKHPDWSQRATIYEVNIRQYTPEGTFRAFEQHLPRLRKMGVDVLWIMPVNPIAKQERKGSLGSYYAVSDYLAVNPEYGDMADFKHLVNAAHQQGFKVILDWVANHTGWDHVWTREHPDWYLRNAAGALEGYHYKDLSDGHEEVWADVIGLDYRKQAVRDGMIAAMKFWLTETGIDGFRCDVAWTLPVDFWDQARAEFDTVKPVFMLAEADTPEMQLRAFDMTYDWKLYHLLIDVAKGKADARDLAKHYTAPARRYPAGAMRMAFTSNHDENSWNGTDKELYGDGADAMAVLAATLPGMPLVYGGQEDGLNKRLKFFDKDPIAWGKKPRAAFYASLLALKHRHPALTSEHQPGNLEIIETGNPKVYAFRRIMGADRVRVEVNVSPEAQRYQVAGKPRSLAPWRWAISARR